MHDHDGLLALRDRLLAEREIALDTEGDSLHHYPARLSLVQLAGRNSEVALVDPLAIPDLAALAPVFGDPAIVTILHAGDNDLADLKRRYALIFASVFDTSIAARFLGVRALGLDALLTTYLGVELPPSRQKDDWSKRPLAPGQLEYAAADVRYLFALKDRLVEELARVGRLEWAEEECEALAAQPAPERVVDPEAYTWLKGARDLAPRGRAILRELFAVREARALAADRPPFKILSDETLIAIALAVPADATELSQVRGCTPRVVGRWGAAILAAVERGRSLPETERPVLERRPRPSVPAAARRCHEALRRWRAEAATRYDLDPGALLPNRLIAAIAAAAPRDLESLARVDGVRRWRVETLGGEILTVLAAGSGAAT